MPQIRVDVTPSLSRSFAAAALVLGLICGALPGGTSGAAAESWRFNKSARLGGTSAASGPGGAELEVSCSSADDIAISVFHRALGPKTAGLGFGLDGAAPEPQRLSCGLGHCELQFDAGGGAALLLRRMLGAEALKIEARQADEPQARELDVITMGAAAADLAAMAEECGVSR